MLETEASRERWSVRIALIAGVIALCAAGFTGWQGWEAHEARRDSQTQFEKAQQRADTDSAQAREDAQRALQEQTKLADRAAQQAKRSADAAYEQVKISKYQAAATERSVEALQNQIHLDQRAWVTVDVGEKTGNFAVSMYNTGKTPALEVSYVAGFQGGKRGVIPEIDLSQNSSSPIPIPRNAPRELLDSLKKEGYIKDSPPTGFVIAPSATQVASDYQGRFLQIFRMEGQRVYVQGMITYDDVFGKNHQTLFCYWAELPQSPLPPGVAPPSNFIMCNDHNKMN